MQQTTAPFHAPTRTGRRYECIRSRFAGHFAGIWLHGELLDETDPDFGGSGPAERVGFVPQATLERILAGRAEELGVEVRRGVELTGFEMYDDHVVVDVIDAGTGATEEIRAGWLVGCDGGRSRVRKLAGFDFPGTDPEITGYQALVEMTGAEGLKTGWNTTDVGTYVHGPMPGRSSPSSSTGLRPTVKRPSPPGSWKAACAG